MRTFVWLMSLFFKWMYLLVVCLIMMMSWAVIGFMSLVYLIALKKDRASNVLKWGHKRMMPGLTRHIHF